VDEPCCFAGFERELADLPRGYLVLFLSMKKQVPAGCVGLREVDRGTAEMKRLYVRSGLARPRIGPRARRGRHRAARAAGYRAIVLDSLPKMREARALYRSLDFRETCPTSRRPRRRGLLRAHALADGFAPRGA
jgi:hypothetical protein